MVTVLMSTSRKLLNYASLVQGLHRIHGDKNILKRSTGYARFVVAGLRKTFTRDGFSFETPLNQRKILDGFLKGNTIDTDTVRLRTSIWLFKATRKLFE